MIKSFLTRNRWSVLAILALAQFMVVLDISIVNVALPAIQKSLGLASDQLQWVITAYTLAYGGTLLLGGRAADLFNRRTVFLVGTGLFAVTSLLDGLATGGTMMVITRALQGLAGAFMSPAALSLVLNTYSKDGERGRALSVWSTVASGGAAVGVLLGGVITQYLNWRWDFLINVPIAILVMIAAILVVPGKSDTKPSRDLDLNGAALITSGLVLFVYGITNAPSYGWASSSTLAFLGVGLGLIATFVWHENRTPNALLPLSLFKYRNISGAIVAYMFLAASMFSIFFFSSLYIQRILHYSAVQTGLAFIVVPLGIATSANLGPMLIKRYGARRILTTFPLLTAVGLVLLGMAPINANYFISLAPAFLLIGLGIGASIVSIMNTATRSVAPALAGVASGLVVTAQQLGGVLGLAISSGVAASSVAHTASAASATPSAANQLSAELISYHDVFHMLTGFMILVAIIGGAVIRNPHPSTAKDADVASIE